MFDNYNNIIEYNINVFYNIRLEYFLTIVNRPAITTDYSLFIRMYLLLLNESYYITILSND